MSFNWRSEGKERVKGLIGTLFLISLITSATSLLDLFLELIQDPIAARAVAYDDLCFGIPEDEMVKA